MFPYVDFTFAFLLDITCWPEFALTIILRSFACDFFPLLYSHEYILNLVLQECTIKTKLNLNWLQNGTGSQMKAFIVEIIFQSHSIINTTIVTQLTHQASSDLNVSPSSFRDKRRFIKSETAFIRSLSRLLKMPWQQTDAALNFWF